MSHATKDIGVVPLCCAVAETPEKHLMYAVFEEAVKQLKDGKAGARESVFRWISRNDRTWPFSFINICEALELDPEYIKRGLFENAFRVASISGKMFRRHR